jgi:hypothetical protein
MFRRKFGVIRVPLVVLTATVATISLASPLRASDVRSGASPGAALSQHKLSAIDEFINGAIASGKIPGAIVLIQHHGQPVYFKCFGQGDVDEPDRKREGHDGAGAHRIAPPHSSRSRC